MPMIVMAHEPCDMVLRDLSVAIAVVVVVVLVVRVCRATIITIIIRQFIVATTVIAGVVIGDGALVFELLVIEIIIVVVLGLLLLPVVGSHEMIVDRGIGLESTHALDVLVHWSCVATEDEAADPERNDPRPAEDQTGHEHVAVWCARTSVVAVSIGVELVDAHSQGYH